MSVAVDQALYSLLTGDSTLTGLATAGVHQIIAPPNAGLPRVEFHELIDTAVYSFKTLIADHDYYQFKGLAADTPTDEGVTLAGRIAEEMRTLLFDPSMSISGKTLLYCRFERSIPAYAEWDTINSRNIFHKGFIAELWLS